ncbi:MULTISPECIES: GntR family transcriptional regulator [unclassified Streptomyces]|uniref:GntR family transcriptional regulator n=1 Tax=unclassified Streptomyces TaxID=2593676 RepID=UPI003D9110C6
MPDPSGGHALRLGLLMPGDQLPTAREVVSVSAVAANTVLKTYRELEREGLVTPPPRRGTFVQPSVLTRARLIPSAALVRDLDAWMDRAATAGLEREEVTALAAVPVHARFSRVAVDAHAMNHKEIS